VKDLNNSFANMKNPGVLVYHEGGIGHPFAYITLDHGPGEYTLLMPRSELRDTKPIVWDVVHDLLEPMGCVTRGALSFGFRGRVLGWYNPVEINVPLFRRLVRPKNMQYANYGETSPEGRFVKDSNEITEAYVALVQIEESQGRGSAKPKNRNAI